MSRSSTVLALTPAERARTILASASTLRVASPEQTLEVHRHGVVPDGSLLFQAPRDFGQDLSGYRVTATAVDVTTVPQPDRLRGTLTLAGPVYDVEEPLPAGMRMHLTGSDEPDGSTRLVRLVPDSVGLAWRCEVAATEPPARQVPLADYRCAFPDPLLGYEAEWLPHLQADHAPILIAIARHELGWEDDPIDVRALGIDRFGLVLRVRDGALPGGTRDLRVGFDRAVSCGCDVRDTFSALLERALPGTGPIC
jgi:hypothetical protein